MTLVTGNPIGNVITQDELYIDSAPPIYYQDNNNGAGVGSVGLLNNPDAQNFFWNLSGTTTNPVYQLGCIENFVIGGNIEMNDIRCDTVGNKGVIQKLTHIDVTFNLKTMFPLTTVQAILRGGTVTTTGSQTEQMGIGQPDNNKYYYIWLPSVYDENNGDFVAWTGFRVQFVDSWSLAHTFAAPTTLGVIARFFADANKPADQLFANVIRSDVSAIA